MTLKVKCPNPECPHHKRAFPVDVVSPMAKKGGNARWSSMTKAQRQQHIQRMTKARIRSVKNSTKNKS